VLPSPEPTATDSFTSAPESTPVEIPAPVNSQIETIVIEPQETPQPESLQDPTDLLEIETENLNQIPEEPSLEETPAVTERIELSVSPTFANLPGAEQILAAVESFMNVGSDMTPAQREESQSVVIAAVLVQQIAQISAAGAMSRRNK
jgi:hypothetical protein